LRKNYYLFFKKNMTKVFDENGNEVTGFISAEEVAAKEAALKAEYEAKLADKEQHLKDKTDEFMKGKTAQELKDLERDQKIAEATQKADQAAQKAIEAEEKRINALKRVAMEQYVGKDPELAAKFEESWNMVNLEIKSDDDIYKRAEMTASLAGLNNSTSIGFASMPFHGGVPPQLNEKEKQIKEADHNKFMSMTGLTDFIPKEPQQ
jgi:hypothetical protein